MMVDQEIYFKKETIMKRDWLQIWANYYSHLVRNMDTKETQSTLEKERAYQRAIIARAEEHLEGVTLFYEQSALADPHSTDVEKKGHQKTTSGPGDTISEEGISDTPISVKASRDSSELSNRKI